jgi:hypothetical protein
LEYGHLHQIEDDREDNGRSQRAGYHPRLADPVETATGAMPARAAWSISRTVEPSAMNSGTLEQPLERPPMQTTETEPFEGSPRADHDIPELWVDTVKL